MLCIDYLAFELFYERFCNFYKLWMKSVLDIGVNEQVLICKSLLIFHHILIEGKYFSIHTAVYDPIELIRRHSVSLHDAILVKLQSWFFKDDLNLHEDVIVNKVRIFHLIELWIDFMKYSDPERTLGFDLHECFKTIKVLQDLH